LRGHTHYFVSKYKHILLLVNEILNGIYQFF
jgi:hypothetical protein